MKIMNLIPRINKSNGQVNVSLPKRLLPKKFIKELPNIKHVKLNLEAWD